MKCINEFLSFSTELCRIFSETNLLIFVFQRLHHSPPIHIVCFYECIRLYLSNFPPSLDYIFDQISLSDLIIEEFFTSSLVTKSLSHLIYELTNYSLPNGITQECITYFSKCFELRVLCTFKYNFWSLKQIIFEEDFDIHFYDFKNVFNFLQFGLDSLKEKYCNPSLIIIGKLINIGYFIETINYESIQYIIFTCQNENILVNAITAYTDILKYKDPQFIENIINSKLHYKLMEMFQNSTFKVKRIICDFLKYFIRNVPLEILLELVNENLFVFFKDPLEMDDYTRKNVLKLSFDIIHQLKAIESCDRDDIAEFIDDVLEIETEDEEIATLVERFKCFEE